MHAGELEEFYVCNFQKLKMKTSELFTPQMGFLKVFAVVKQFGETNSIK